ncbi:MAG: UDP-2,3-diacylglucosamine diphosphatase [bacterium]
METSQDHRVLIIADAHLPLDNRPDGEREREAFRMLLRHYRDSLQLLVLLGDVFDFWYEWRHVIPKRAFGILADLRDLVDSGVETHYFAGNHDFRLSGFLRDDIGLKIHMDEWRVVLDERRYWFHHGDGLAASDVNYRRMKRVFRSPLAQALFGRIIHPDLAMGLGRTTSDEGRRKNQRRESIWPPVEEYYAAAQSVLKSGEDVVVVGHTHIEETRKLDGGVFHNPGAFHVERRYSLIEGGLPHSEVWR